MTAARSASRSRRWASLAAAFSLTVSLVAIPATPSLAATDTYRDNFDSGFSGNDGKPFATDWLESGESDGPGAGGIKVETEPHCASGPCLTLGRLGTGGGNVSVEREVDLSLASSATVQFDFKRHDHVGVSGQVVLEVSADGGGGWDPLQTWDLSVTDPAPAPVTHDISSHRSVDTRIRFRLINDTDQSHFNVDNLVITAENDLSVHAGGIVINEVLFDQTPGDNEEFVEVLNATSGTVSLAGWQFSNRTPQIFYTFPPGTSLAAGEYAVVWLGTVDPGGLRDASSAAFQDGANQISNFLWDNGDAIWLHDDAGLRVDFVAWGTGSPSPPPEWDATHQGSFGGTATARGQSISLTPNGVDGNDSACWEPTTSGDAAGRCAGYIPTADVPPVAQIWTPGFSNQGPTPNIPPAFDQDLLDRADSEGTLVTVSAGATDPDPTDTLTYTASGLPEGISLDPGTGLLTGAPGPNAAGTHAVTITVTDDGIPNEQDTDTFTWTVSAGEVAYLVANTGGGNGGDDQLTAVDLTDPNPATNEINIGTGTGTTNIEAIALQPGTDTLFAVENNQLGTIDPTTGTFTALPSIIGSGNGAVGFITFDNIESLTFNPFTGHLYATHRRGDYQEDVLFRIEPTTGAAIPGVFGGNDYAAVQQTGGFYHVSDLAFDPTDGQLYGIHWTFLGQYSIATIDPLSGAASTVGPIPNEVHGLAFSDTGGLWGTTADTPSPYFLYEFDKTDASVISTATIDNGGNYEAIAISFPFEPNQPPAFDQDLLDQTNPEGTTVSISAGATDPDPGDTLLYTATSLPPDLTIDPNSGLITGTISFAAAGTYAVEITTTDNGIPNLNDVDTLIWTITDLNQSPVFDQDLPDRADAEGTLVSVSAGAADPDPGDTLTYSATGLPEGISLNPATGLITGALGPNSSGTHAVTITVTDNGSPTLNDVDTFTWTVSAGEVAYLVANTGGGNGGDDQLTAVDLTDPNPATNEINIGTGTGTTNIEAIALQPGTDTLFAVENNQLGTNDPTTGTFTALPSTVGSGNGAVGFITFDNIESLAFNPFTGHLYATHRRGTGNEDVLFRIDPTTGAITSGVFGGDDYVPIEVQATYYHVADLAFDPTDGQLYGIHWDLAGFFSLATINPDTGATATIGAIPYGVAGLAFSDTGGLWGTTADTPSPYFLYEFDKTDASVISTATIDNGGNYEAIAISFPFEPNQPPAFDQDLLDQTNPEGTTVSISAGATDPDPGDTLLYTATSLPPDLTIDPNSGLITGTISFAAAGTYAVEITTTDNGIPNLNDVDTLIWTITEANQPPAFDQDLLDRSDAEGATISLSAGAADPDPGDTLLFTAIGLPTGLGIDPGSGLISGTVPFTASGTYPVTITVTDNGSPNLNDTDTFTWTVANTNRPPAIVNPGAQTTPELAPFSLLITASDPDLTTPSLSDGGTLPAWATLTDNLDGTATISGTPGGGDSATSTVTITADDGLLSDDAVFDLTVTNTNLPPAIVNPGNQVGSENAAFSLTLSATDPDTTLPNFTDSGTLPGWATLTDHGDGTATIAGTPGYDDAAITTVTITVSDGALTDDAVFDINIANTNRPPTVDPVPDQTVAEADPLTPITVTATDPDLTTPALTATGLPTWAGFTDNLDGTATITGTPGYDDAATHTITITAADGTLTGTTSFTLTITNTNRAPTVTPIADQTVAETAPFSLVVAGTDPDLTVPFLNVAGLPAWAGFTDNGDGTATIAGTPGYEDAATHPITITATDDGPLTATETFTLTITNTNRAPTVDPVADQTVAEADPFTLTVTGSDPDLTTPVLTATGLPAWAGFTDNLDGTATITGTPGYDDAATHPITITATDGTLTGATAFTLTITNTNRAPTVDPVANQTVAEADPFTLTVAGSDPDLTTPALTATGLPAWAGFTDNGDGTATITGTPGYADAGAHVITVTADDGSLTGATAFALTITNTNLPPVIVNPGNQVGSENAAFSLTLSATDPDTTLPNFTDSGTLPGWATLTDHGDGTATIAGTPGYDDAAITTVTITVSDGALTDDAVFDINIANTNRPPTVDPVPDQTVAEADPLTPITVTATDPDLTTPALTATGLPTWAGFTDNLDGTATITGTPGYDDAATHTITITATDGTLTGTTSFTLTITNTNRAPTVTPIADQTVAETAPFSLVVAGTDPDLTVPFLNVAGLPAWAGFTDNGDGTATIAGTPGYEDAATHPITITATDDGPLTATETFTLTITNTNRAPGATDDAILIPAEAASIVFAVLGNDSDPDGDAISVVSFDATTIGTVTDEGGGTFRYVPDPDAPYAETFTYTISDPDGATATATVYVSVTAPAPLPPIPPVALPALVGLAPIYGTELAPIGFTAAITLESDVGFTLVDGPAGAVIDPATGVFSWVPTESQGPADYTFVVRITDPDGTFLDESVVAVSVGELETAPSLLPSGPFIAEPGTTFTATFLATDPDLPARSPRFELSADRPPGAVLDPATGVLVWDITPGQPVGRTEVTIRVVDGSDPTLHDEMTITVTVGAASSSQRKATLIEGLLPAPGAARSLPAPAGTENGVQRTLVIMARAGMGSAQAFGAPFLLLALLTVLVIAFGRISIHPLLGRSRRQSGTVAWFDAASGYGFIIPDQAAEELFLHRSALGRGRADVAPGDRVSFRTVKGSQRSFALKVRDEAHS